MVHGADAQPPPQREDFVDIKLDARNLIEADVKSALTDLDWFGKAGGAGKFRIRCWLLATYTWVAGTWDIMGPTDFDYPFFIGMLGPLLFITGL